jgi:hypothetical protein
MSDPIARAMARPPISPLYKKTMQQTSIGTLDVSKQYFIPFELDRPTRINRINFFVGQTQGGRFIAIGIYDKDMELIKRGSLALQTEKFEVPATGLCEVALPDFELPVGAYWVGFYTNADTATFGLCELEYGYAAPAPAPVSAPSIPILETVSGAKVVATLPALKLKAKEQFVTNDQVVMTLLPNNIQYWATDPATFQLWGADITTFPDYYFYRSVDSGTTWAPMMRIPGQYFDVAHVIIFDGKMYVVKNDNTLYVSSDLTENATWTDITCPNLQPNAIARLDSIIQFNRYIFQLEYTGAPTGELPDGCLVHRYNIDTGTWAISQRITGIRHLHCFYSTYDGELWMSAGDTGHGSGLGIWHLAGTDIGNGSGGENQDLWVKWTDYNKSIMYPIHFIAVSNVPGAKDGLYMASDAAGRQLLYCKVHGNIGEFIVSNLAWQNEGDHFGESVEGLVFDYETQNLYWLSNETPNVGLYMSKPPYTQSQKIYSFDEPPVFIGKSTISFGHLFNYRYRFALDKFAGQ